MRLTSFGSTAAFVSSTLWSKVCAQSSTSIVSLPYEYTYLLPDGFNGTVPTPENIATVPSTFVNSTTTTNSTINEAFRRAAAAPLISYSDEFTDLFGADPNITLIEDRPGDLFAFEGAVWIPNRRQVWFTSAFYQAFETGGYITILDLDTNTLFRPNTTAGYRNFQRGVYSQRDDTVYFTSYRDNSTYKGGLVTINPDTYAVETVFNSYFGLTFNGLNELALATKKPTHGQNNPRGDCEKEEEEEEEEKEERYLFVNDISLFLSFSDYSPLPPNQLHPNLYRWDLLRHELTPIFTETDIPVLGSGKISPDLKHYYLGSLADPSSSSSTNISSTQTIYKYDLDETMHPVNKKIFAVPRFFLDAMQIDDEGRVWSAEGDGYVVRNPRGRILGVVNRLFFERPRNTVPFGNLVLAGDVLVVLAVERVWTVKLSRALVRGDSPHVFG